MSKQVKKTNQKKEILENLKAEYEAKEILDREVQGEDETSETPMRVDGGDITPIIAIGWGYGVSLFSPVVVHLINKKSMEDELVNDMAESAISAMFQALEKLREIGIERHSAACSVAEMTMDGVDVQVQVMITPNKLDWLEGNETAVRKVFPFWRHND